MFAILALPIVVLAKLSRIVEKLLFVLITLYDHYVYSPLQVTLSPVLAKVPRFIHVNGEQYTVFSANIVSWSRTFLVIPIAVGLKYEYYGVCFWLVVVHDFLDHVDGIVAKVQKNLYGKLDDPLLGGFMDAFCDKIVNVTSLWTILLVTDFRYADIQSASIYVLSCAIIIAYEFIIGVVRVQDYFRSFYERKFRDDKQTQTSPAQSNTAAVMEGKLKEKLESLGIAFLCLSQCNMNPCTSISGITGVTCLVLSIRLAHASLQHKLKRREETMEVEQKTKTIIHTDIENSKEQQLVDKNMIEEADDNKLYEKYERDAGKKERVDDDEKDNPLDNDVSSLFMRQQSLPSFTIDGRVDKVYSVGCFDLFHNGHVCLLQRMRTFGRQLIVGVHDSRSIYKLKKRVPIDNTEKRMLNVRKYVDMVYCIAGTDPTPFLQCMISDSKTTTSMYIRGNDMKQFPARDLCEQFMPVKFLPYSQGVSSTKIRKETFNNQSSKFGPHVCDDGNHMFY